MAEKSEKSESAESPADVNRAVLFDLESLVDNLRTAVFDVLKKRFKERGASLDAAIFQRYGLDSPLVLATERLARAMYQSAAIEGLRTSVQSDVFSVLASPSSHIVPGADKLLAAIRKKGWQLAAMTVLPPAQAEPLLERLGLAGLGSRLFFYDASDRIFPGVDCWLRAARDLACPPRGCLAIVNNASAARSALAAGLRVAAVPDRHTAFQDFGGTDAVADAFGDLDAESLTAGD